MRSGVIQSLSKVVRLRDDLPFTDNQGSYRYLTNLVGFSRQIESPTHHCEVLIVRGGFARVGSSHVSCELSAKPPSTVAYKNNGRCFVPQERFCYG